MTRLLQKIRNSEFFWATTIPKFRQRSVYKINSCVSADKKCSCPGSNRRPLACEASVITTTLQVPTRWCIYLTFLCHMFLDIFIYLLCVFIWYIQFNWNSHYHIYLFQMFSVYILILHVHYIYIFSIIIIYIWDMHIIIIMFTASPLNDFDTVHYKS